MNKRCNVWRPADYYNYGRNYTVYCELKRRKCFTTVKFSIMSAFQLYRPGNDFEFCCQISENSCFVAKTKILCACQQSKQRYYVHASNQNKDTMCMPAIRQKENKDNMCMPAIRQKENKDTMCMPAIRQKENKDTMCMPAIRQKENSAVLRFRICR